MANTKLSLSSKVDKTTKQSEVLIQLRCGNFSQRVKSRVFIYPKYFKPKTRKIVIDARIITKEVAAMQLANSKVDLICNTLIEKFQATQRDTIQEGWAQDIVDRIVYPENYTVEEEHTFFERYEQFIDGADLSVPRYRHYKVMERILKRYELYTGRSLSFGMLDNLELEKIRDFIRDEHKFFTVDKEGKRKPVKRYAAVYATVPEYRYPEERGQNYLVYTMKIIRAFINWALQQGYTHNDPFRGFKLGMDKYGTPIYITTQERDTIYNFDLSEKPHLERQRDVFVFQCLLGCRIGDLYKMTKDNLVEDSYGTAIEYIPEKTKKKNPRTVKVYLHPTALAIIGKYEGELNDDKALLPLISQQKYNDAIKEVFRACGITRMVPVLDTITRKTEMKPICDVASSHMARRTFVGNLYKQVKDPNLVGKLSGHAEGSRAFARYRDIDDEMISDMTKLL